MATYINVAIFFRSLFTAGQNYLDLYIPQSLMFCFGIVKIFSELRREGCREISCCQIEITFQPVYRISKYGE